MSKSKISPKDNAANQKNGNNGTKRPNEQYKKAQENTANQKRSGK